MCRLDSDKLTGAGNSVALKEFAGLTAEGVFLNNKHTYSYGTHIAHVAVDAQLGRIELVDYLVVQDVGRAVNPLMVRGQVLGSLVQGLGGAVLEELKYDENGQLLTGSLVGLSAPHCERLPEAALRRAENYPSPNNPLGVKGAGDGGIYAGGSIANAVANALQSLGVQPRAASAFVLVYLGAGAGRIAGTRHDRTSRAGQACAQGSRRLLNEEERWQAVGGALIHVPAASKT